MRFIVLSILLILLCAHPSNINGCGGGTPAFIINQLARQELIVEATVLEVDDRGYSAILQVSQYFKGQAGEYLAIMRFPPALETVASVRDYDTGCLYSGYGQEWQQGTTGYFALESNGNGTYSDIGSHFIPQNDSVEFHTYHVRTDTKPQSHIFQRDEFEALLLSFSNLSSTVSPVPNAYPLMRFLNITTASGQRYRLNPDRSISILDPETSPTAISNDGSHVMFNSDQNQLGFQYLSHERKPLFEDVTSDGGWIILQNGQFAVFSPDSNFVTIDDTSNITIYMFHNYERGGYGQRMSMMSVATTQTNMPQNIVWSGDSTAIAYQDDIGIWVWDIFESSEPLLVVDNLQNESTLFDLSLTGRYVRFGQSKEWELFDTHMSVSYTNAIATPDERNLIYIQPDFPENIQDINRRGNRDCQTPLALNCPIYISFPHNYDGTGIDIFWYKHNQIGLFGCQGEFCYVRSSPWQLSIGNSYNYETQLDQPLPFVNAFDYDMIYDQPVVAINGTILEFGFYPNYERDEPSDFPTSIDSLDMDDVLDSTIVQLEWGLPIFYQID